MHYDTRWTRVAALATFLAACGVSNRHVELHKDSDASAAGPGDSGTSAEPDAGTSAEHKDGGKSPQPGQGGSGGTAPTPDAGPSSACHPACSGATPVCSGGSCVECMNGDGRCAVGDVPEICEGGKWAKKPACGGSTPVCSNGKCGAVRLSGAMVTVGDAVLSSTKIRLVNHGLEYEPLACGMVKGSEVCVTGGLQP
jgi:hypothetical protein